MDNKVKIIYIINSLKRGGPVNMLYNLVKYIDKDKFEVIILSMSKCSLDKQKDFSDLRCNIIEIEKSNIIKMIKRINKIVGKIKPDIIHSHGGKADIVNTRIKGNYKRYTTVHCVPDEDFIMKEGKLIGKIKSNIFINNIKKIDKPIACSETVSKKILNNRNISIDYIRNGIDLKENINITNEISKEDLGIDINQIVLVFCGYLSKRKNVKFIIDAFEKSKRKDLSLLILGDGEEFKTIYERCKNNKNIFIVGRVDNPYRYLKCADYFISASISEGLPLAVMEGLSYGLPALLSDIESHQEIKKLSSDTIKLFSNNNVNSLINCLNELSKKEYIYKSENACKLINDTLNAERMCREYEEKYII